MVAWVVIDRTHSRQTPPSFFHRCHSYFGSHRLLIPEKIPPFFSYDYELQISQRLCFDIHTKCPGVYPPRPCCFHLQTFQRVPSYHLSFQALAHSFARDRNSTRLFSNVSALFAKNHPGWGVGSRVSTHLNWLSPIPFAKIASLPAPCRQVAGQTRNHDE